MSYQVFLQGRLVGIEQFLATDPSKFVERLHWTSLLSEVLPRAVLAELELSPVLLGSSGAAQFLLVLPDELRTRAVAILLSAQKDIREVSGGNVLLACAVTENLGTWTDIRKRLDDQLQLSIATPPRLSNAIASDELGHLNGAASLGWSPERPALITREHGKHQWQVGVNLDQVPFAMHQALDSDGEPAATDQLAASAKGQRKWGVLVGNVDDTSARLNLAQSIEEYLQLSTMYKQFFAGEVQMLCSQPEAFQKITLLRSGGDSFALYGSWDALVKIAREMQRLFALFVDANLSQLAGLEGKTISMAIALARPESSIGDVYLSAVERLESAKSAGKDSINAFGRIIDWKQLAEASVSKETMVALVERGASPQLLGEIAYFYRETEDESSIANRHRADRLDRPWRFYRRLNSYLGHLRGKETQRLRTELIDSFTGRRAKQIRLRPQERVALEWANLELEQA